MSSVKSDLITPAEYLAIERAAETKSEYIDGRMYATSGASRRHNIIAGNLFAHLHAQLRGGPCEVYHADMRVRVTPTMYTYPDVVAVCGEPEFEDSEVDTLLNPTLIIEVLSRSTEGYDRGKKFEQYRKLASLREYVLVSQDRLFIDRFVRENKTWLLSDVHILGEKLVITSIGCEVDLADIYERVDFLSAE